MRVKSPQPQHRGVVMPSHLDAASSPTMSGTQHVQYPQFPLILRFRNPDAEAKFLHFLHPTISSATSMVYLVTLTMLVFLAISAQSRIQTRESAWYAIRVTLSALTVSFVIELFALISQRLDMGQPERRRLLSTIAAILYYCSLTAFAYWLYYAGTVREDCLSVTSFRVANSEVYRQRACHLNMQSFFATALCIALLSRVRLQGILGLLAWNAVVFAIVFSTTPYIRYSEIYYLFGLSVFCYGALIAYLRYHHERLERDHFCDQAALESSVAKLEVRREALEHYCAQLLPPALVARSGSAVKHLDHSPKAVVLVVGVHDFIVECTKEMPMKIAGTVDFLIEYLSEKVQECGLERVMVVQDEFVAVGNLLKPQWIRFGVSSGAKMALTAVRKKSTSEYYVPPLQAAVHVGPATGGFVGHSWIRYDVVGEGIDTCRAARLAAETRTTVLTEAAQSEVSGDVEVADGPSLEIFGDASQAHSQESRQRKLFVVESVTIPESFGASSSAERVQNGSSSNPNGVNGGGGSGSTDSRKSIRVESISSDGDDKQPSGTGGPGSPDMKHSSSATAGKSHSQSLSFGDLHNLRETQQAAEESVLFGLKARTAWGFYMEFCESATEDEFQEVKRTLGLTVASQVWMAYAAFTGMHILLLLLDAPHDEMRFGFSLGMLLITVLASVAAGLIPKLASKATMRKYYTTWSGFALIIPLFALFAAAVARPAYIGNDVRALMLVANLVRSFCFPKAKHQLIIVPVLLVASGTQYAVNDATFRAAVVITWVVILSTIVMDRNAELHHRERFALRVRLSLVSEQLTEGEHVRQGLIRSTVPAALRRSLRLNDTIESMWLLQPHSVVMLISCRDPASNCFHPNTSSGNSHPLSSGESSSSSLASSAAIQVATKRFEPLEELMEGVDHLSIVRIVGDTALVVGPVVANTVQQERIARGGDKLHKERLVASLRLLKQLSASRFNVITELEATIQVIRGGHIPSYSVMGIAVTRLVAISKGIDSVALNGVLVTSQFLVDANGYGLMGDGVTETAMPGWRIRGAGMVRLVKLTFADTVLGTSSPGASPNC